MPPKLFGSVNGIDKELLATCRPYPAELALFVISPDCRGKGVGETIIPAISPIS